MYDRNPGEITLRDDTKNGCVADFGSSYRESADFVTAVITKTVHLA